MDHSVYASNPTMKLENQNVNVIFIFYQLACGDKC